jgi:acetyltransferase-like isoleucine patch superfamily enzyme
MQPIVQLWRNWNHGRKFVKKGKHCRFKGKHLLVDGHVELGDHVRIRDNCIFRTSGEGKIIFKDRSGCSWYCIIEATKLVQIGRFTGIAEFTVLRDTNHVVFGTDAHWRITPHIAEPIIIGESCLIGSRCYIGPGVTIGDGAVVAPGSIVTKDIGPYEVWAGSPARFIAHRTKNVASAHMRQFRELAAKYGMQEIDRHGVYNAPHRPASPLRDLDEE